MCKLKSWRLLSQGRVQGVECAYNKDWGSVSTTSGLGVYIYIYITDFLAFAWRLVLQIVGFEKLRA